MYKGNIEEDARYICYSILSKKELIRKLFSYFEIDNRKRKYFKENRINNIKEVGELNDKIDELKEFVDLLKDEIKQYTELKPKRTIKDKKTYLIKDYGTGFYKIGFSVNPSQREKTLQSEKPNIKMIKVFDKNIEKELHSKYDKFRVRGEWFNLNNIQVKYICTHF